MPPKKKNVLEGHCPPGGLPFYVDKDYRVHYGKGLRTIFRLASSDTGPLKKRKEITEELVLKRIADDMFKKYADFSFDFRESSRPRLEAEAAEVAEQAEQAPATSSSRASRSAHAKRSFDSLSTESACEFERDYEAERRDAAAARELKSTRAEYRFLSSSLQEGFEQELGGAAALIASQNNLTIDSLTTSLIQPGRGKTGEVSQPDIGDIGEMLLSKLMAVGLRAAFDDIGLQVHWNWFAAAMASVTAILKVGLSNTVLTRTRTLTRRKQTRARRFTTHTSSYCLPDLR